MTDKHTPGKWEPQFDSYRSVWFVSELLYGHLICDYIHSEDHAALIARAPELEANCEALHDELMREEIVRNDLRTENRRMKHVFREIEKAYDLDEPLGPWLPHIRDFAKLEGPSENERLRCLIKQVLACKSNGTWLNVPSKLYFELSAAINPKPEGAE